MATPTHNWTTPNLLDCVIKAPHTFSLWQVQWLLIATLTTRPVVTPQDDCTVLIEPAVKADLKQTIRIKSTLDSDYPATEVQHLQLQEEHSCREIITTIPALLGSSGLLPQHYTTLARMLQRQNNTALFDFIQLIQHRSLELSFLAAIEHDWSKQLLRAKWQQKTSPLMQMALAFKGKLPIKPLLNKRNVSETFTSAEYTYWSDLPFKLHRIKSLATLQQILKAQLQIPIVIKPGIGRWQHHLGFAFLGQTKLAQDSRLGRKIWQGASQLSILLGPFNNTAWRNFLPQQSSYLRLQKILRDFLNGYFSLSIQLVIDPSVYPLLFLGNPSCVLGHTTRLGLLQPNRLL